MHISIPKANTMEYVQDVQISPLIGKGVCKVCYVGQDPNRNGTVITKELAADLGRKLPGSPVVGFFDKDTDDFAGHERELILKDGQFDIVDITQPYGFVPTDADVWFEKFDDEGTEHEYLCTEVYIWTGVYPESQRILDKGNNQSMELDEKNQSGFWTKDGNSGNRIFIYNEALIKKLCILGENVEPCFEGASIQRTFSLGDSNELETAMYSMMQQMQETLSKGGFQDSMENIITQPGELEEFEKKNEKVPEEPETQEPEKEEKTPDKPAEKEAPAEEEPKEEDDEKKKPASENSCDKKKYNLEEVVEYAELQTQYAALQQEKAALEEELASLREFKLVTDRQNKQNMIDSFYMLSEADKQDVVANIDTYSLDDIEAKLSILCVRNKVNFNLEEKEDNTPQQMFNLHNFEDDNTPAWVKAVKETAQKQ